MRATSLSPSTRTALSGSLLLCLFVCPALAQPQAPAPIAAASPAQSGGNRVVLDRVVAVVNGQLIMQSDVDEEERFAAFEPLRDQSTVTEDQIVDRLVDRALILQQAALQPQPEIADAQVDAELASLRKTIPECAAYHCESDAGWLKFIADHGFTLDQVRERWRTRMEVLRFIETRFRTGILDTITPAQIDDYYRKTLLPAYAKQKVAPPNEDSVASRIQEILLQQQVNKLLDEWLKSLRAQGSVQIMQPGETVP